MLTPNIVRLVVFVAINVSLFWMASENSLLSGDLHPTYENASDGQRYWGVAINVAKNGSFIIGEENGYPLSRAGPLPALFFSIPIKVFGIEGAPVWIVLGQCVLLYLTGVIFGRLGQLFHANEGLVCGLIIFNPNLISLAHHAQSDLIFTFVFALLLYNLAPLFVEGKRITAYHLAWVGISAGVLPLARPLGIYILAATALLLLLGWILSPGLRARTYWSSTCRKFISVALLAALIMSPWAYRNYLVFGEISLTQSEGIMMKWHYNALKKQIHGTSNDPARSDLLLERYEVTEDCANNVSCKSGLMRAYLAAIWSLPKWELVKSLSISNAKLFFTGGASQLGRYLGLDPVDFTNFLFGNRTLGVEKRKIVNLLTGSDKVFVYIVLAGILFAGISRFFGVIGVVLSVTRDRSRALSLFFLFITSLFMGIYLFSSIGRFRAPLEPILALFAASGLCFIRSKMGKVDST
jgi:hypothetical protein